ncbi:MAG: ABC transporter ATP-binding protein [Euryarchaeota archaeon]|nr:ABC transporter ATP-binding protein [Euryarchaeota archaeon]
MKKLLNVSDLKTYFYTYEGVVKALEGINLDIYKGESFGLVGETGCGKSVTALSIMRLIQWPPGKIIDGKVEFDGKDLLSLPESEMRKMRGAEISMIFQEPMSSLNPIFTIGGQIAEAITLHQDLDKGEAKKKTLEMLNLVGMPNAEEVLDQYPHELSGGMQQRAMIAMALSCKPALLIADEPTTALDVTVQAQILELIQTVNEEMDSSMLLITHDLGVIAQVCERVAVMYAGYIVEVGKVKQIFKNPYHPYTKGLVKAIPKITTSTKRLEVVRGVVPNLITPPPGCRFHPRCDHAMEICKEKAPKMIEVEEGHQVACFLHEEVR